MTTNGPKNRCRLARWLAMPVMMFCWLTVSAQEPALDSEVLRQAEMIFVGTVEKIGAAATADVPAADDTAVVMIERLVTPGEWSPLRSFEGRSVTVRLTDPGALSAGSVAVFYTRLWTLGEGLALIELAHESVGTADSPRNAAVADATARVTQNLRLDADRTLQARIERADIVVMGEVSAVRKLDAQPSNERPGRLSEHDPQWREAVIDVSEVIKGSGIDLPGQVAVQFSGSNDVMWASAPKFQVGQSGIFILMQEQVVAQSESPPAVEFTRTMTDSNDYLLPSEAQRVRTLLQR